MKKIGIVDYFIDEWHSNTYLGLFENACKELGLDYKIAYGYAEVEGIEGKISTDEWCNQKGVERCYSIDELCEKSDNILILAPANPETHLRFAEEVFKFGKTTYVDKTFAPDTETALKIIDLGKKYGTKFFSTSALRYVNELNNFIGARYVSIDGGGRSLEEYIIHQIEMLVKTIGTGAKKVKLAKQKDGLFVIDVCYPDDRKAQLHYKNEYPFIYRAKNKDGELVEATTDSNYFQVLINKILNFFETDKIDFKMEETIEAMKLREAVIKAKASPEEWITL
ncbi:MAG: hypothetical protein E7561_06860 [Ruminococcaceae bacterium]|nr:hypothetical protein [Oscillospiraceae bacterium]